MKINISKSQIEVWEWKESLFEELKNIPKEKRLEFIRKKVKKTIEQLSLPSEHPNIT